MVTTIIPRIDIKAMTKNLQSTWLVGKARFHHAGYGVYTIRSLNSPADRLSGPYESGNKAVDAAEKLATVMLPFVLRGHPPMVVLRRANGLVARIYRSISSK
jgi:hypothetical protein